MKRGIAHLPLHGGKAPRWLMERMIRLAREILIIMVSEYGSREVLRRLSDPFWFQSFGCLLGFDWHSSGVTTTVTGAVKSALSGLETELNLFAAGGKGGRSRKTPDEIAGFGDHLTIDPNDLIYLSRLSAKIDNTAVMDGYQLYLHTFFFTSEGDWAVVQQGMNEEARMARRYHWLGETVSSLTSDPQAAICCDRSEGLITNLVDGRARSARDTTVEIAHESPESIFSKLDEIKRLALPRHHEVFINDIHPDRIYKTLLSTYEQKPGDFESLLLTAGMGPKTLRALSLIAEVIFGAESSFSDPARFSFAHGGKDGHPYPVDRENYDCSIDILRKTAQAANINRTEKIVALKRLDSFYREI